MIDKARELVWLCLVQAMISLRYQTYKRLNLLLCHKLSIVDTRYFGRMIRPIHEIIVRCVVGQFSKVLGDAIGIVRAICRNAQRLSSGVSSKLRMSQSYQRPKA